jgi:glycosyltransferase involved in cell wall biosynthesis
MAYYNRPEVLANTLLVYSRLDEYSEPVEIIIVDDGSTLRPQRWDPNLNVRYIRLDRPGTNPCLPFNIAVKAASNDTIVLTNPECLPLHNVGRMEGVKGYEVWSCLSMTKAMSEKGFDAVDVLGHPYAATQDGGEGWYVHPKYNPRPLHFLAAMPRQSFLDIGGFDEDFRMGVAYEDDDFVRRIHLAGLPVTIRREVVLHQWHYGRTGQEGKSNVGRAIVKAQEGNRVANQGREWGRG